MQIAVRPASAEDASALSLLGAATFRETFADANTSADMAQYLANAFSAAQQATEIADPKGVVLVAEDANGGLVGYAHLVNGDTPAAIQGPHPLELKRIYVARAWHGGGVAQTLMDATIRSARTRGAETLWLGVWERNPRAVAFYVKYGFSRVGEHTFQLGADVQTDWLFARSIAIG